MRHIAYISGTRADFGLMKSTLQAIAAAPDLRLSVFVTGMHLDLRYGRTVEEIKQVGLDVAAEIPVPLEPATGATMGRNIGIMTGGFVDALEVARPDIVLLLGDRGEMLAGALAAIHLNIPTAHIHGGERSGTVDESVRHSISKLAHFHFTATREARQRLVRMGEAPDHVHVTGAPGLDGLREIKLQPRRDVLAALGFEEKRQFALMVFHPVLQEADAARADTELLLDSLRGAGCATLALMPNSDAGSAGVREALEAAAGSPDLCVLTHLPREQFVAAMAVADIMVGNSSAGIIEAASFGTPVLNIGRRQNLRERNENVRDAACAREAIEEALDDMLSSCRFPPANVYGDGRAGERIVKLLSQAPLTPNVLNKVNSY